MSIGAISFNEQNFECYTPKYIVDMFGTFDYDPATTKDQAKALGIPNYSTIDTDGLKQDWTQFKRIWITPPFGCVIFKLQSQNEIKFFNIVILGQHSILNETDL